MTILELKHVTKRYRRTLALDDLSLTLEQASVLGIVGLPGAGRSTLLRLVGGLEAPTRGQVLVLGGNPCASSVRRRLTLALHADLLDRNETVQDSLVGLGRLRGLSRAATRQAVTRALEELGLQDAAPAPVGALSASDRQLVCIAACLLDEAEVLLFDDLLGDLDASGLERFRAVLRRAGTLGKTMVLADSCLTMLGDLCDRIALLHRGRLLGKASPSVIRGSLHGLLFKYSVEADLRDRGELQDANVRWDGSVSEVLADRDLSHGLSSYAGTDAVREIEPTFAEACDWILHHPQHGATRSRGWGETSDL